MVLTSFAVATDTHGFQNIDPIFDTISSLEARLGRTIHRMHLGDVSHENVLPYTVQEWTKAARFLQLASQEGPLRKAILEGKHSKLFLEEMLSTYQDGIETSDNIGKAEFKELKDKAGGNLIQLAGNWDRAKPLQEVFDENLLNGNVIERDGYSIMGFSGSGSQPKSVVSLGLAADDVTRHFTQYHHWKIGLEKYKSECKVKFEQAKVDLKAELEANGKIGPNDQLNEEQISDLREKHLRLPDLMITHVPLTDGKGVEKENGVEMQKSLYMKAISEGFLAPELGVMWGHRHGQTSVKFNDELGTLVMLPGVGAVHHNHGSWASSIVVHADSETRKVSHVDEYRIYHFGDGRQEVVHHGIHKPNYDLKTVDFKKVGKTVFDAETLELANKFSKLDPNYEKFSAEFNWDYSGMSVKEIDAAIRLNVSKIGHVTSALKDEIKIVLDGIRTNFFRNKGVDYKLTNSDEAQLSQEVFHTLARKACEELKCDYSFILRENDEMGQMMLFNCVISAAYGLGASSGSYLQIRKSLVAKGNGKLGFNWGSSLLEAVQEGIGQRLNEKLMSSIKDNLKVKELQEMAELYLTEDVERRSKMEDYGEALSLYAKAFQNGYMSSSDFTGSEFYQEINGWEASSKINEEELDELLSCSKTYLNSIPGNVATNETADRNNLVERITSGDLPVIDVDGTDMIPINDRGALVPLSTLGLGDIGDYEAMSVQDYQARLSDAARALISSRTGLPGLPQRLPGQSGSSYNPSSTNIPGYPSGYPNAPSMLSGAYTAPSSNLPN